MFSSSSSSSSPMASSVAILLSLSFSAMVNGAVMLPRTASLNRTTEAQEAAITDPKTECSPYTYEPVAKTAKLFPANWGIAKIMPNDTEALEAYNAILSKIPTNIKVKGKPTDSETGTKYSEADPDCWWTYSECTTPKLAGLPNDIVNVPEPNTLGYGFDDGPYCSHNEFYNFLTAQNQKATMFYIGSNVQSYPLEAQRAVVDGHEICSHTWSHQYSTALTNQQLFAELWYTNKMIKLATGVTPTCWRPPYGDIDDRVRAIAHAMNLTAILWTYDTNDWSYGDVPGVTTGKIDANYDALIKKQQAGAFNTQGTIVLTHEVTNFTMSEAIKYHPLLAASFSHMVPVGVAYNWTQPYAEANYSQPSFAQYVAGTTQVNGSTGTSSSSAGGTATSTGAAASSSAASDGNSSGAVSRAPAAVVLLAMLAAVGGALITMA